MPKYAIKYRYNEQISGYALGLSAWYKCQGSALIRHTEGYSGVNPVNPFTNSDVYDIAKEQALSVAAANMTCKSKKSGESKARLNIEHEFLLVWTIQKPIKHEHLFVPDMSYKSYLKKYGKFDEKTGKYYSKDVTRDEYYFLKKYYKLEIGELTDRQQKIKRRTIIKHREVIESWPTKETRRVRKEIGEL